MNDALARLTAALVAPVASDRQRTEPDLFLLTKSTDLAKLKP